ncbi:META domain-containing protein [Kibdelosporangium phytohabitans]|uniref:DUF306 domain-containing protein n=1 Tax=Kibdelosporangium phytohabitans TaxID=860235 RepID=A0A0N9I687_9PSEU|nr:META domain-containing protein [Kibdelosporangium phytohabitans]ALG13621.1 hypothetical protein AOZ06_48245 [Kibdelosporangium phytohabitans]MBE1465501.1 heat shock protein HslJ [Kibdelosporangium phytohabitans]
MRRVVIVGALGLLAAGCGGGGTTAPGGNQPNLSGQVFLSKSVTEDGKPRQLVDGTRIRLEFTQQGEIRVRAGCNHMSGPVDTSNSRLSADGLAVTDMGCDKPRHEQDTWLTGLLGSKPEWRYDGTTLTLKSGATQIQLATEQPADLEGPTWVADTVVDGNTATTVQAPAWVTFKDGAVEAGNQCNQLGGRYQATPEKVTFREVTTTQAGCPQADEILPLLDGELTYRIDDETLTLTKPSGKGLQLKVGSTDNGLGGKEFVSADGKTQVKFADGKLNATIGCNDMTGSAVVAGGKLVVQNLGRTRKACEPAVMEQEDKLADLLKSFPDIQITGTGLQLRSSLGELALRTR